MRRHRREDATNRAQLQIEHTRNSVQNSPEPELIANFFLLFALVGTRWRCIILLNASNRKILQTFHI